MKYLLLVVLAGCAVKCDDNNYYVIEMPEDRLEDQVRPFSVYWNVPTMQCKSKKIPFENLYEDYGILQNQNDSFRGEQISILYDPGLFPALLKNETSGKFKFRNGGVPQEGDLELHLKTFRSVLEQSIPDPNFRGVGIIDFESWRPIFRQNFGILVPYKDISIEIEKKMHWWWPKQWIQAEAQQRFEEAAREFMQTTLSLAKQMRPNARWGYYGFPYCFNMANNVMKETCADKVPEENDRTYWLWSESTALYPSVYSSKNLTSFQLAGLIRGRVKEAERVKRKGTVVLPYFWFRYRDGGYMSEEDLSTALETLYNSNASGFIVWGSSNDVNTVAKCNELQQYLQNTLGPAISAFTKPSTKLRDDIPAPTEVTTTDSPNTQIYEDPDFNWNPPENYVQDIKNYVEEEIKRKGYNISAVDDEFMTMNDSLYMEIILNNLLKEQDTTANVNDDNLLVDVTTESSTQTQYTDASQTVDISTGTVQNLDTNTDVYYSTEALPTELNSHTEVKDSSPENSVIKLIQNYMNTPEFSATTVPPAGPPQQDTSQETNVDFLNTRLSQNLYQTTDTPIEPEINDLNDYKSEEVEIVVNPQPADFLSSNEKYSSLESTAESQDKKTTVLPTESLSFESAGNTKDPPVKTSTVDLVANLIQREAFTTEPAHNSENLVNTYSGEYLVSNQNIQKATNDLTTDSTIDKNTNNGIKYLKNNYETTTLNIIIRQAIKSDADPYNAEQKQPELELTTEDLIATKTLDNSVHKENNFTSDLIANNSTNEKEMDGEPNAPSNQDNSVRPVLNTISEGNLTKTEVLDNLEGSSNVMKEDTTTTLKSTTELDQVNVYVL